jgi:hypothetical protein
MGGHEISATIDGHVADTSDTETNQNIRQNVGGTEESFSTQAVLPQVPQAILRFQDLSKILDGQREFKLQLPTEPSSDILINLGRLKSTDPNSVRYQQLVRISDPNRPPDKQIISREHSQISIHKSDSGEISVSMQDSKDHERRKTVLVSQNGESRVVDHANFQAL